MPVVSLIRPDDINKCRIGSIAAFIQPVPAFLISIRISSALQVGIQLIRIDILLGRGSDPETAPCIHAQEHFRKSPVTNDTHCHSENKKKSCIGQKAFKSNAADFEFTHSSSYCSFLYFPILQTNMTPADPSAHVHTLRTLLICMNCACMRCFRGGRKAV